MKDNYRENNNFNSVWQVDNISYDKINNKPTIYISNKHTKEIRCVSDEQFKNNYIKESELTYTADRV